VLGLDGRVWSGLMLTGGVVPLGTPAPLTTGCLSAPEARCSTLPSWECQISSDATTARPVTDSNQIRTERLGGKSFVVMGYSLPAQYHSAHPPQGPSSANRKADLGM